MNVSVNNELDPTTALVSTWVGWAFSRNYFGPLQLLSSLRSRILIVPWTKEITNDHVM